MLRLHHSLVLFPHCNNLQQVTLNQAHLADTARYLLWSVPPTCSVGAYAQGGETNVETAQLLVVQLQPPPQVLENAERIVSERILSGAVNREAPEGSAKRVDVGAL